ncbi:MAG: Polysaccharide biosynthesis protein [Candidatus Nomurabacteria bacterium GW2011_GWC2_41_8]|uniref:Polysaccharide biosynthesis protein n=1 Tax=Candidatus Nomurabacteria bacterium GW2011_GWC2_41_8 TaxID=1618755 RepID=A0A0G1ADQ3_9BACT|nr:MAG: Polysaccharide biosynthesis protein [Candidatus Nomurabacteria bacterium GW2011_GWC2_41_8]
MLPQQPEAQTPLESAIGVEEIKHRSVKGVAALISRTFVIQIISFAATFGLTVFLDPSVYGVFFLVSAVVNFLAYFSDIGLAAALVQKKDKVTDQDLATTFTVQQGIVISLLILLFASTPLIRTTFQLSSAAVYLMWSLGISLFFSSLKTIPSILLERELQFNKLVIPQVAETIVFNLVAVFFAWRGLGITAFTLAVLARGVTGLVLVYLIFPWKPKFGFSRESLSNLLKFGLPFQANNFLAVIKDDGMTVVLGKLVGADGLGYLGWASRWAGLPLRIFMDNVTKVAFPAFSRLQHDKERLAQAIEMSLKYLTLSTFPILIGMAMLANPLVHHIPRYLKWLPALIPLYFYVYNSAWACVSTSLTNTLNALGQIKTTFKLMVMWVVLTWLFMPILGWYRGYLGVSLAVGLIATSSLVTVIAVRKHIRFSLSAAFKTSIISSLAMLSYLLVFLRLATNIYMVGFLAVTSGLIYLISVYFLEGKQFLKVSLSYFKTGHA